MPSFCGEYVVVGRVDGAGVGDAMGESGIAIRLIHLLSISRIIFCRRMTLNLSLLKSLKRNITYHGNGNVQTEAALALLGAVTLVNNYSAICHPPRGGIRYAYLSK